MSAICSFSKENHMLDITPVENLFIEEFMLQAPGEYVKVYLYGLKMCYYGGGHSDLAAMARALRMEPGAVKDAFYYWQQQGVVLIVLDDPFTVQYCNVKGVMFQDRAPEPEIFSRYRSYTQSLQALFGSRLLVPQDLQTAIGWLEDYKLPQEVALLAVKYSIDTAKNGRDVSIKYIDKVCLSWAKDGINTAEAAWDYLEQQALLRSDISRILKHLGLYRLPTKDEEKLYQKWMTWGFTVEAVLAACAESTKSRNPSFGYLDRVLADYRDEGLISVEAIQNSEGHRAYDEAKRLLLELGSPRTNPTRRQLEHFKSWRAGETDPQVLVLAARECNRQGRHRFEDMEALLAEWSEGGLVRPEEIERHLTVKIEDETGVAEVLKALGLVRQPTQNDRNRFNLWKKEWGFSQELLALAAEYAQGAKNPWPFMSKILQGWREHNITSVEAARQEHDSHEQLSIRSPRPKDFISREDGDDSNLDELYTKL